MPIRERLKEFLKEVKLSEGKFERQVGLSNGFVSSIGDSIRTKNMLKISEQFPKLNQSWLLTGEGEMFLSNSNTPEKNQTPNLPEQTPNDLKNNFIHMRLALKNKMDPVPIYNTKAAAGQVVVINDEPELIVEYIQAPFLKDVQGVIEVAGHSMYPKFPNGSRLAIKRLEHIRLIRPGEDYYLIDLNYEGYVKRLYKSKDPEIVILRSYNEDKDQYPDFEMKWEEIVAVFKVKAGIQLT